MCASNIPAIIGSGTLYFALAAMLHRFSYFEYALAVVPVYIGTRIFLVGAVGRFPGDLARGDLLADHR